MGRDGVATCKGKGGDRRRRAGSGGIDLGHAHNLLLAGGIGVEHFGAVEFGGVGDPVGPYRLRILIGNLEPGFHPAPENKRFLPEIPPAAVYHGMIQVGNN